MNAAGAHLIAADQERLDGTLDRSLTDPARRCDPLPQANDTGERIDHPKTVGGRARDQEPAIVGAEVERRVGSIDQSVARGPIVLAIRTVAAHPIPCPPGPTSSGRWAIGKPARGLSLLAHSIPSCRAGAFTLNCRGPRSSSNRIKCISRERGGQYCAFCAGVPCPPASLSRWTKSTMSRPAESALNPRGIASPWICISPPHGPMKD